MATSWQDIADLGEREPPAEAVADGGSQEAGGGVFKRLRESLSKSRRALTEELSSSLFDTIDEDVWERLEEALILADTGAETTAKVVERLEGEVRSGEVAAESEAVREQLIGILAETAAGGGEQRLALAARPAVILVVGVNGTGKTTTIGKLAWQLSRELGLRSVVAAADTYRAAASEQLGEWAARAGAELVQGAQGADPGAVAYDAVAAAQARGADAVIVDTAGRLHNKASLMDELSKVRRVIAKQVPGAPHETLLTIDATTGQNGLRQAGVFSEAVSVDGVVLTKLDGTARGGVTLTIADTLGIPVKLIGLGEAIEDLRPFDPEDFARALIED